MPHHGYPSHLVERQRMLSDLRKVLIPAALPMVCRMCYTVQEDEMSTSASTSTPIGRCLCEVPAWVPLDAVLHELNHAIKTLQGQHRTERTTITCEKVA